MKRVCLILVTVSVVAAACASPHNAGRPSSVGTGTTLAPRPTTLAHNPLFRIIREVKIRDGATGLLYANEALFTWSDVGGQATDIVTRIDLASARVTATASLAAVDGSFAGDLLWLTTYAGTPGSRSPSEVVALNPTTLAVVHTLPIPGAARYFDGSGQDSIAAAGGLIWVFGADTLYGIDPATATIVRRVPTPPPPDGDQVGDGEYQIAIGAPPDRKALWSAESPDGGGYDALQVRNPQSGAVIDSSTNSVSSVGETHFVATDTYAWLAYGTGMSGSYLKVDNQPGLPPAVTYAGIGGSNAISVSIAADDLWVYDPETHRSACVDPANGAILEKAVVQLDGVSPLPHGEIAVISQVGQSTASTVAVANPQPTCAP